MYNWIVIKNIGKAKALLNVNFGEYQNQSCEITGTESKYFFEVTDLLSDVIEERIKFRNVNPISFYLKKRIEGVASGFAIVMIMLHFLTRFQREPEISDNSEKLTGTGPTTLQEFIAREKEE